MIEEKKFIPNWKIYSPTDLSKKWFIYYRKDGKRLGRTYGNINSYKSFDERISAAEALIKEKLEETPVEKEPEKTLAEKMYGFLDERKGIYRKATYSTYKSKLKIFLEWLDDRPLTKDEIKDFFNYLLDKNHRTTYNLYRRTLKKVLDGIGQGDVINSISKIKTSQTPAKYFQRYQIERLKKFLSKNHYELWFFCQFIYYCFLRPGELREIKVSDIDLDRWRIRLKGENAKNWKFAHVCIPKQFRKEVFINMDGRAPSEYLFPSKRDPEQRIGRKTMTNKHRKILNDLGFGQEYKLYSWKHTGAVACVEKGINIKHLQIHLRHHDLETVDKYLRQLGFENIGDLEDKFPPI